MFIDLVKCTVRLNQSGNISLTTIVKAGPDALPATEIPVLQLLHNTEGFEAENQCVQLCEVVGTVERTKSEELERLAMKYGPSVVQSAYPGGRGMPTKLDDLELPPECIAQRREKPKSADGQSSKKKATPQEMAAEKKAIKAELEAAGIEVPSVNLSLTDLKKIRDEYLQGAV